MQVLLIVLQQKKALQSILFLCDGGVGWKCYVLRTEFPPLKFNVGRTVINTAQCKKKSCQEGGGYLRERAESRGMAERNL
jgi:hypothetical protein